MSDLAVQFMNWKASGGRGLSAETMFYCALGVQRTDFFEPHAHPHDPSDFNRCLLLLERVPAIRDHFDDIAKLSPQWEKLIAHWGELEAMFIDEVGFDWCKGDRARKTYERMQEVLG